MTTKINDFPLRAHNTFGLDVRAAHFLEYASEEELTELIHTEQISTPYLHIGGGSNLLFTDRYYPGTILHSLIQGKSVPGAEGYAMPFLVRITGKFDHDVAFV